MDGVKEYLRDRTDRFRREVLIDILKNFPGIDLVTADTISMIATEKHIKQDNELVDYLFNKIEVTWNERKN